jgi:enolase-phosphatase E1
MIKAVITDIEGTTSSISFVKDELFPYARAKLPGFVRDNLQDSQIRQLLADACTEAGLEFDVDKAIAALINWLDADKKITPLKALQGLIWQAGYEKGEIKGHLYEDAAHQLKRWKTEGYSLYVYSSGSVLAQKLLFGNTAYGDLTPLFSGYFDTNIGGKKEAESYRKISAAIATPPSEIVFLSDIKEELDAAKAAGYHTIWLNRDTVLESGLEHRQVGSFAEIDLEAIS